MTDLGEDVATSGRSAAEDDLGRPEYFSYAGRAHLQRFQLYGRGEDREEAVHVAGRAADYGLVKARGSQDKHKCYLHSLGWP